MTYWLYPIALFLSAGMMFIIQPVAAKVLLPIYGGTPAVWTVCMLFFQSILLVSYAYVWGVSRLKNPYHWKIIHVLVCLVSLLFLPMDLLPRLYESFPEMGILKALIAQLGMPLLVVAASAPLLQYAYSLTDRKDAADPYYLYVSSNIGSLLGLLGYPLVIEPLSTVPRQFYGWTLSYLVYLVLLVFILFSTQFKPKSRLVVSAEKITWRSAVVWIVLSFIPCSLMLGVTFFLSTDVSATPLLWVLPLTLYLLSFIITFAKKPLIPHQWVKRNTPIALVLVVLALIIEPHRLNVMALFIIHLSAFFMISLLCHGELVKARPHASKLTAYYFYLALGGVLGGVFNSLLAPILFSSFYEYPLVLLLAVFWLPIRKKKVVWLTPFVLFLFLYIPWSTSSVKLVQARNFYGIKSVISENGLHRLMSQSTLHGFQMVGAEQSDGAAAYYAPVLPAIRALQVETQSLQAMILGLGVGIMTCQFRDTDQVDIIEIDKQVIDIAKNTSFFTYLRDCKPDARIIVKDGRLAAAEASDNAYDVLVVDVFSSDSIPTHMLTLEAFNIYQQKLKPNGMILVNISNRHLNLLPVVTAAGRVNEQIVLQKAHQGSAALGELSAEWVILTMNEQIAGELMVKHGWRFVAEDNQMIWHDNYSNIMPLLRLFRG